MTTALGESRANMGRIVFPIRLPEYTLPLSDGSIYFLPNDSSHLVISSETIRQLKLGGMKAVLRKPLEKAVFINIISPSNNNHVPASLAFGDIGNFGVGALIARSNSGLFIPVPSMTEAQYRVPFDVSVVSDPSVQREMPAVERRNSIVLLAMKDQGKIFFGELAALFKPLPIISDI